MTSLPSFTVTTVLREAAELRVEELEREKQTLLQRYHLDNRRSAETNIVKRVTSLLEDIKTHNGDLEEDEDLQIMSRYVQQGKEDKTIESKLLKYEEKLWAKLNKYLRRLEVSSFHVSLMLEAFNEEQIAATLSAELDKVSLDDDFEVVGNQLDDALEKFARDTFTASDVDENKLETYLTGVIESQGAGLARFRKVQDRMEEIGESLLGDTCDVEQELLIWSIVELLKSDTVSAEKKKGLQKYLHAPIALRELATTIEMKSLANWKYRNSDKGLPVNAYQGPDGRYSIVVEEEIVDMIFLRCIATHLGTQLKEHLKDFVSSSKALRNKSYTKTDKEKRKYYLNAAPAPPPVIQAPAPQCPMCNPVPPPPPGPMGCLPPPPPGVTPPQMWSHHLPLGKSRSKRDKTRGLRSFPCPPSPPPPQSITGVAEMRREQYIEKFCLSRLPEEEGSVANIVSNEETMAQLIKTLAIEAKMRKMISDHDGAGDGDGSLHVFSTKLNLSTMPHNAIIRVMKFLGFPEKVLDFFTRFLKVNLNTGPTVRGSPDRILPRACGIPAGHCLETVIGEIVLCFLEMAVSKKTTQYLYHVENEVFFLGTAKQKLQAIEQIDLFCEALGIEKTTQMDRLNIGCLTLNTSTGSFEISDDAVGEYALRVKQQLDAYTSVLNWICIWNNSCGTYAEHLFGPLATVFGKSHVERVKAAYNQIFSIIFPGTDLTTHIKRLLLPHTNATTSPLPLEAIIYLPQAYGGLGVKNPFVALNLAHDLKEDKDMHSIFEEYFQNENNYYDRAKEIFALYTADQRQMKLEETFGTHDRIFLAFGPLGDTNSFMSKKDLTAHREFTDYQSLPLPNPPSPPGVIPTGPTVNMQPPVPSYGFGFPPVSLPQGMRVHPDLKDVYKDLQFQPNEDVMISERVGIEIRELQGTGDMKPLRRLSSEEKWVLQMYGDECFEWFGTLQVWWPQGVPTEVYKAVRGHLWGYGDDDDDDASSVTSMTESRV